MWAFLCNIIDCTSDPFWSLNVLADATIGFENSVVSVSESESNYSPNLTVLSGNIDVDFNVSVKYDNGTATGQSMLYVHVDVHVYWMLSYL